MTDDDNDLNDEARCELLIDLDCRCPNAATQVVAEPFTPAAFEMQLCDDCAQSQIDFGYHFVRRLTAQPGESDYPLSAVFNVTV